MLRFTALSILVSLSASLFIACDKDDEDCFPNNATTLYWNNTLCDDPWDDFRDVTWEQAIGTYLSAEHNIKTVEITTDNSNLSEVTCMACTCTDGAVYEVTFYNDDVDKALELGFSKKR